MKLKLQIIALAAIAAFTLAAQQPQVAAKPSETSKAPAAVAQVPPQLPSTAKLWRLVSKAQALRQQLNDSPAGKEVSAAETELQAEQQKLAAVCASANMVLGYDADKASPTFQDVVCQKATEPAKADPPKGK